MRKLIMHSIIINLVSALKCERAKNVELEHLLKTIQTQRFSENATIHKRGRKKQNVKPLGQL